MASRDKTRYNLRDDLVIILAGIGAAILLAKYGALDGLIGLIGGDAPASFAAGIFFTSAFTIAPAALVLARMAETAPVWTVVSFGALGAMFGDLAIFFFLRDRFATDLEASIKTSVAKRVMSSFHYGFLKWLSPILGAFIIASPLPDELGLGLMGLSRTKATILAPIALAMNALGIYLIVIFARGA